MNNLDNNSINSISESLKDLLRRLKSDRDRIIEEIRQVEKNLAALGNDSLFDSTSKPRKRRQRGSNKKAVRFLFESSNVPVEATAYNIANALEIPRSSIQSVLDSLEKEGFLEQLEDGCWRKKGAGLT